MRFGAIFLGISLMIATPVVAENHTFDGCDLTPDEYDDILLPILDGAWQVQTGPGVMLVSNGTTQTAFPVQPEKPSTGTFSFADGILIVSGQGTDNFEVTVASPETLGDYGLPDQDVPGMQDMMDFEAIGENAPNCSTDVLPVVTYSGDIGTAETPANFEAILHVISADLMSGILITNVTAPEQGQIHIRRFITFQR